MGLIPLNSDMSNKADFINSLFDPGVRNPSDGGVQSAARAGQLTYCFCDPVSRGYILNAWLAGWQKSVGDPYDEAALTRCPAQDLLWLEFMASYLADNALALCWPQISLSSINSAGLEVYRNVGYARQPFILTGQWQYGSFDSQGRIVGNPDTATVARFLEFLFFGAHMVAITSDKDTSANIADYRAAMTDSLPHQTDKFSSHYGGAAVGTGRYYDAKGGPVPSFLEGDIESLQATSPPGGEPVLIAFLAGVTASTHSNQFLQLEGWPSQNSLSPPGGVRHNADYETNEATFWNVSTFGACAYSEKRSTPIFLAPSDFSLKMHSDTGMPYYWGANAGNVGDSWMHPDLVVIKHPSLAETS